MIVTAIIFHRCNFCSYVHSYIYPLSLSLSPSFRSSLHNRTFTRSQTHTQLLKQIIDTVWMFDFCMCYRAIVASTLLVYHFQCRQCNVMFQANLYKVYFTIWQLSQHSTFTQALNSSSRAVKLLFVMLLACGKCVYLKYRRLTCNQADWRASKIFYRLNDELFRVYQNR